MDTTGSIQKAMKFDIEKYAAPTDVRTLLRTHAPYTGSPQKHPLDRERIILIPDPYNAQSPYLEFDKNDVTHVEKLPNVVDLDGGTVTMARIWVKKGSLAIQCTPFRVMHR
jgi:inorganic pyrophosphatase